MDQSPPTPKMYQKCFWRHRIGQQIFWVECVSETTRGASKWMNTQKNVQFGVAEHEIGCRRTQTPTHDQSPSRDNHTCMNQTPEENRCSVDCFWQFQRDHAATAWVMKTRYQCIETFLESSSIKNLSIVTEQSCMSPAHCGSPNNKRHIFHYFPNLKKCII